MITENTLIQITKELKKASCCLQCKATVMTELICNICDGRGVAELAEQLEGIKI